MNTLSFSESIFEKEESLDSPNVSTITRIYEDDKVNERFKSNISIDCSLKSPLSFNPSRANILDYHSSHSFQCEKCLKEFQKLSHITIHSRFCKNKPYYQCWKCQEIIHPDISLLLHHLQDHDDFFRYCNVCGEYFTNPSVYASHINLHIFDLSNLDEDHEVNNNKIKIEESSISRQNMLNIIQINIDYCNGIIDQITKITGNSLYRFNCEFCDIKFSTRCKFQLHKLTHNSSKQSVSE